MSKYTTMLRWIVEQEQGTVPASNSVRYTQATYKKIGLDKYPIFNESYRKTLNDKIIDHFWFREIGFETCAQFEWYMRRTMNEIMPYYNELYIAQAKIDDPLSNIARNWKESWNKDVKDTGTVRNAGSTSSSGSSSNRNIYEDTPMSLLDNTTPPTVQGFDYATNVTYDNGSATDSTQSDTTRTLNTNENDAGWHVHDESGRNKSQAELMKEYMEMFVNIDMKVIHDLEDLFMGLW